MVMNAQGTYNDAIKWHLKDRGYNGSDKCANHCINY